VGYHSAGAYDCSVSNSDPTDKDRASRDVYVIAYLWNGSFVLSDGNGVHECEVAAGYRVGVNDRWPMVADPQVFPNLCPWGKLQTAVQADEGIEGALTQEQEMTQRITFPKPKGVAQTIPQHAKEARMRVNRFDDRCDRVAPARVVPLNVRSDGSQHSILRLSGFAAYTLSH
jgi:hypothetical protein